MKYLKLYENHGYENVHEELPEVLVDLSSIDYDALRLFRQYLKQYPSVLGYEYAESGIHPLNDTINYFRYELREPEHQVVRLNINRTGRFNLRDMKDWISVNRREMERMNILTV